MENKVTLYVLYWCEFRSLTVREESQIEGETRVLGRISGSKRERVA
jgi:hypothetical protein